MLTIQDGKLYEDGKFLAEENYWCMEICSPETHRTYVLAKLAFTRGIEAANRAVSGFDRTGLPECAWLLDREIAGFEKKPLELKAKHKRAMKELSRDEWRTFNSKDHSTIFSSLNDLWMADLILSALSPLRPYFWFRLLPESE